MSSKQAIKKILISLIESIDMYNFLLKDHHRRTTIIAYQLGKQYGLEPKELSNLVLAASIHDIGALHVSERDQLLYIDAINTTPHEIAGEKMLHGFKPFSHISRIIRHHHIKYNDVKTGIIADKDVPIECYFVHLADRIDVLLVTSEDTINARDSIINKVNERFGAIFNTELKETFNTLAQTNEFWDNINNSEYHELLLMAVQSETCLIDDDDLDALAELFARIVDHKSSWTTTHSKSVSLLASKIAELAGLDERKRHNIKIAGYLHDIGKIAIPSEILDKPAALDDEEYEIMKSHAAYSALILSDIQSLKEIARWASGHHEKRDSSGYPLKISEKDFVKEIDIIAYADIFAALMEDRPYRKPMTLDLIIDILGEYSITQLDSTIYDIIKNNAKELYAHNQSNINDYNLYEN